MRKCPQAMKRAQQKQQQMLSTSPEGARVLLWALLGPSLENPLGESRVRADGKIGSVELRRDLGACKLCKNQPEFKRWFMKR